MASGDDLRELVPIDHREILINRLTIVVLVSHGLPNRFGEPLSGQHQLVLFFYLLVF